MPRPPAAPVTALGAAMQVKRGTMPLHEVGAALKVSHTTLSRIERGANRPTYDTARALADWLGWTVDEVMQAARALTASKPPTT